MILFVRPQALGASPAGRQALDPPEAPMEDDKLTQSMKISIEKPDMLNNKPRKRIKLDKNAAI